MGVDPDGDRLAGFGALRSAWSLLTVLGGGRAAPHRGAACYYGVVGMVLGAILGSAWWALSEIMPEPMAAVVVVALDLGLTGLLHADGLADSADGLLAPMERSRRLEVMRRSDVGPFGVAVLAVTLLARTTALAVSSPRPLLLLCLWSFSRGATAAVVAFVPYARPQGGLPRAFSSPAANRIGAASGVVIGVVAAALLGGRGLAALAGATLGAVAVTSLARQRLGGYTGDVLGAVVVLSETVGLVTATVGI